MALPKKTTQIGIKIMKKIFKYLAVAASVAALAVACEKAQTVNQNVTPEENTPGEVTYDSAKYLLGFSASFEITKADLNDSGAISWSNDDKVKVFNTDGESALYVYNGNDFEPDGTPLEKNGSDMYACFPADKYEWVTDHVQFTMPEAFQSLTGIQNPMAGIVPFDADATTSVVLKNLGGIFEVKLSTAKSATDQVTKLELGNSGVALTGKATLDFSGENPAIGALDGEKSVTLEFASPLVLDNTPQSVFFFLPVSDAFSEMYVKAIFGKSVGEVTYEPSEQKTRKSTMNITRGGRWNMTFSVNGFFSGGDGSENNPYQISSSADFMAIATLANATSPADGNGYNATAKRTFFGSAGVYYEQTADLDFGGAEIPSIGVYNATAADAIPFQGTYAGNGYMLEKFKVVGTQAASTGLFEYVDGAHLCGFNISEASAEGENVTGILTGRCIGNTVIETCDIVDCQVTGRNSVGAIAHITGSTIVRACHVSNLTVKTADSGADANNQGGVVGFAGGASSIESCSTSGTIQFTGTASGAARGGIVGKLDSTGQVKECVNNAVVTNALVGSTGGVAGQLTNGTIVSCANTANVSGTSMVGGIVGFAGTTGTPSAICFITSCRTNANVSGTANCVAGIAGKLQNGVVMSGCYAAGNASTATYDVAGLVGAIQLNNADAKARVYVYDCIANMNVTTSRASGACRTGGAVGYIVTSNSQYVAVDNCGVLDVTITAAGDYVGGFVGRVTGDGSNSNRTRIRNCYTLVDTVPGSSYKGGFVGAVENKAELRTDYFVANDSSDISENTVKENYAQKTASEIQSAATCTTFNNNKNYSLTVGSSYSSALGWAMTNGYPVPGALIALGSEYYK